MSDGLPPILIPVSRPTLGPEELEAVGEIFASHWLSIGAVTREFERTLEEFLDVPHVLAVNSGSAALSPGPGMRCSWRPRMRSSSRR